MQNNNLQSIISEFQQQIGLLSVRCANLTVERDVARADLKAAQDEIAKLKASKDGTAEVAVNEGD